MKNVHEIEIKLTTEWEKCLDDAFKKKVKETKVDGFRKGACPKDIFIKRFGIESLYMDAVDEAVAVGYKKALEDNKDINPVIEPKVDIKNISAKEIEFKFTIITKPEITLGDYKNLGIKKEEAKVSKKEIDEEIKKLQDKFADLIVKEDGIIEDGNTAVIDFKGTVDGQALEGGSAENYSLEIGTHSFIPGFEEGLVGHKTGDIVTLNLKFPEDYVENLKGKDVVFEVKVNEVKVRVLPEINEEFFKDLGYDDVKDEAGLKEKVKADLLTHKEEDAENKYLDELIGKAVENLEVEINPEIIEDEKERMIDDYRRELSMQGISLEQYLDFTKGNLETLKKNIEPQAVARIKTRYLLEGIVEKENLTVTDDEVKAEVKRLAEMYGTTEEEITTHIGDSEVIGYDLKMRKALDFLKEN